MHGAEVDDKPDRDDIKLINPVTNKVNIYALTGEKRAGASALEEKLRELNSVATSYCGKTCVCLYDTPDDDKFDYSTYMMHADVYYVPDRTQANVVVHYKTSYQVLKATLTVMGTCAEEIADRSPRD